MIKYYIVYTKSDDYGRCNTEFVETTPQLAKDYYHSQEVSVDDVHVLKKYFDLVPYSEESERSEDRRFYGVE